jgi:hypothetical protein
MHLEVDKKYYLWQEEEDGEVLPVLDSLDLILQDESC